jgi:hypothetical protein
VNSVFSFSIFSLAHFQQCLETLSTLLSNTYKWNFDKSNTLISTVQKWPQVSGTVFGHLSEAWVKLTAKWLKPLIQHITVLFYEANRLSLEQSGRGRKLETPETIAPVSVPATRLTWVFTATPLFQIPLRAFYNSIFSAFPESCRRISRCVVSFHVPHGPPRSGYLNFKNLFYSRWF